MKRFNSKRTSAYILGGPVNKDMGQTAVSTALLHNLVTNIKLPSVLDFPENVNPIIRVPPISTIGLSLD